MTKPLSILGTIQNEPQAQIGTKTLEDAVHLVKALETPYLRDLRRLIDAEILSRAKSERSEAIFKIQKIATDLGVSLQELMSAAAPKERKTRSDIGRLVAPAAMKYQNPANESQKWSGRGLAPGWVKAWEAQNGSRDGLLIAKQ